LYRPQQLAQFRFASGFSYKKRDTSGGSLSDIAICDCRTLVQERRATAESTKDRPRTISRFRLGEVMAVAMCMTAHSASKMETVVAE
jgi:hypothetical protein